VILNGGDRDRLAAVADAVGGTALTGDLADPSSARSLAQAAVDLAGRVDVLVSNAGIGWCGGFTSMTAADTAHVLAVNLHAPIELTRALLPGMRAGGRGHLVYVGSIAGRTGVADEAVYAASKAGLDTFAESLRFELAGTGVGVSTVVPGVVDTPFFGSRGRPYGRSRPRPIPPDTVAEAIERLITSGRADRYVPGWLAFPAALRVVAPGLYRTLATRFGGS
jgi:short-subunit dehydrogenase